MKNQIMPNIDSSKSDHSVTVLNGQVYDVLDYEEFAKDNTDAHIRKVAITETVNGKNIVLPYRGEYVGNPINPGIYNAGCIDIVIKPSEEDIDSYIPEKIINFSSTDDIKQTMENSEELKNMSNSFITNPDNITQIPIDSEDQPEMVGLKTALNNKQMNIDDYAFRFGDNFPNDKRQLKNHSATLKIINRFATNCDMEVLITFKDKNENVPNPMGSPVTVSLTDIGFSDDEDEE